MTDKRVPSVAGIMVLAFLPTVVFDMACPDVIQRRKSAADYRHILEAAAAKRVQDLEAARRKFNERRKDPS